MCPVSIHHKYEFQYLIILTRVVTGCTLVRFDVLIGVVFSQMLTKLGHAAVVRLRLTLTHFTPYKGSLVITYNTTNY